MNTHDLKTKLQKSVDFFQSELAQIRTGRANPALLEDVQIMAYEAKMTLKEVGSITLQDAQTILVSPWDTSLLSIIAKAIRESEHKLNAVESGNTIRVAVPPLTEERRMDLAKLVSQKAEDTKQALRNIRQDAIKEVEKSFADKKIGEDDKFSFKEEIDEIVKGFIDQVETLVSSKKQDLLTV